MCEGSSIDLEYGESLPITATGLQLKSPFTLPPIKTFHINDVVAAAPPFNLQENEEIRR